VKERKAKKTRKSTNRDLVLRDEEDKSEKERKAKKTRKSTNRDLVLRDEEERFLAHRMK
jgi:hypothetical protein